MNELISLGLVHRSVGSCGRETVTVFCLSLHNGKAVDGESMTFMTFFSSYVVMETNI